MDFETMKSGYLPVIIRKEICVKYYEALDKAMVYHDYTDFIKLVVSEEIKMLDYYLKLIG